MGLFGSIIKTGFDIITTPIAVVKDIATMGGDLTDKDETYLGAKLRKIDDDVDQVSEDIGEL